eukprot:31103-Pelagococcus_subviridis.AAC.9
MPSATLPRATDKKTAPRPQLHARRLVPLAHDLLHVRVRHEERDEAVRDARGHVDENPPVVLNHPRIVAHVKLGAHRLLVRASGDHDRTQAVPGQRHRQRYARDRVEGQKLGVQVDRGQRPGGDEHVVEAFKDGRDGERRVEARQLQHRIRNVRIPLVVRLQDEREALLVRPHERAKVRDERHGVELLRVHDLERLQERRQTVVAKLQRLAVDRRRLRQVLHEPSHERDEVLRPANPVHERVVLRAQPSLVRLLRALDLRGQRGDVPSRDVQRLLPQVHRQRLDAHVVDVVRLVEHHDALLLELPAHQAAHLGIEQVLIVVHDDVAALDHVPRGEVRAPAFRSSELPQIREGVHPRGKHRVRALPLVVLEELAQLRRRLLPARERAVMFLADPRRGELPAPRVDGLPRALLRDSRVHAHHPQLREDFLHLRHRARAVDELPALRVRELIGRDQREARDRLPRARGHLQASVPFRVQPALELLHVLVLLRVEVLVREVHGQALEVEDHGDGGWEGSAGIRFVAAALTTREGRIN